MERIFKNINCIYCEKEFAPNSSKQKACSLRHDFPCPTCGKIMQNKENRMRHTSCRKCDSCCLLKDFIFKNIIDGEIALQEELKKNNSQIIDIVVYSNNDFYNL